MKKLLAMVTLYILCTLDDVKISGNERTIQPLAINCGRPRCWRKLMNTDERPFAKLDIYANPNRCFIKLYLRKLAKW